MRRACPYLLASILFLTLSPLSASAETIAGLPLHVEKIAPGAIRLWVGDHISSTAPVAIATKKGLVIIDTTGLLEIDREMRRVIARELGRDDFAILIDTHEHDDHTGGNGVYDDCTIVGHELVAAGMARSREDRQRVIDWYEGRLPEMEQNIAQLASDAPELPRLREELIVQRLRLEALQADRAPVPPTRTFAERMTLDMGDVTFELYYIGGMHTASDIAVLVPERGLLLTGDTMADVWLTDTPGCLASFAARGGIRHDFPLWLENWHLLLDRQDDIRLLLPGHWNGELSYAGAAARVAYIETLWNETRQASDGGRDLQAMLTDFQLAERFPELVDSPGFNERNNHGTVVEIWREVTGQQSAARALHALVEQGADDAEIQAVLARRDAGDTDYYFLESEINGFGYDFIRREMPAQAVRLFRINVELYPEAWNVYDSLGEALLATGERNEAVAMYEKSVALNPENANGVQALERLRAEGVAN